MARGTELEAPSFFCDLAEERPEEKILFHIQKSIPRQKKKKEYCKGFFWRAYRRGDEAEGGAYGVTTDANTYAEVSHHHALRA